MKAGTSQVRIDQQDSSTILSENNGKVKNRRGFSFTGTTANHRNGVRLLVRSTEEHVGSQHPIGLSVWTICTLFEQLSNVLRNDS